MADFLAIPHSLLRVVPLAMAAGVDAYLVLLISGIYRWKGETLLGMAIPPLPPGGWVILPGLGVLYVVETLMELHRPFALAWHSLQRYLRPLMGGMLGLSLLQHATPAEALAVAALAAGLAWFGHGWSWGQGLLLRLVPRRHVAPPTYAFAKDGLALALAITAWEQPRSAFFVALAILVAGAFVAPPYLRLAAFGQILFRDLLGDVIPRKDWAKARSLPKWLQGEAPPSDTDFLRGMPAAARRLPGYGKFRVGWLVESGGEYSFVFKEGRTPRWVPLPEFSLRRGELGPLALRVPLPASGRHASAIFLPRSAFPLGGPSPADATKPPEASATE